MKYKTPLLLLILALSFGVQAQPAPLEEPLYKFRVIGWNRDHLDMFYPQEGEARPIRLMQGYPSKLQEIPGPENLTFYIPVETEEGVQPRPLVQVTLHPPPAQNLIVIWLGQNGRYQSAVLKDDPEDHVPGKLRLVNLSGNEVRVLANREPVVSLEAGDSHMITPLNEGVGMKVSFRKGGNSSWEMGMMTGITVRQSDRVTAFIADPSRIAPTLASLQSGAPRDTSPLTLFTIRN